MKTLQIFLDREVKHTCYVTINFSICGNAKFFEGGENSKPLKQAKNWAKKNGYTHLEVVSLTTKKQDKIYIL